MHALRGPCAPWSKVSPRLLCRPAHAPLLTSCSSLPAAVRVSPGAVPWSDHKRATTYRRTKSSVRTMTPRPSHTRRPLTCVFAGDAPEAGKLAVFGSWAWARYATCGVLLFWVFVLAFENARLRRSSVRASRSLAVVIWAPREGMQPAAACCRNSAVPQAHGRPVLRSWQARPRHHLGCHAHNTRDVPWLQ